MHVTSAAPLDNGRSRNISNCQPVTVILDDGPLPPITTLSGSDDDKAPSAFGYYACGYRSFKSTDLI